MSGDDFGRLGYLVLLLVAVSGWFIAEARVNLGKSARQVVIWGLIFVGFVGAYGLWGDIRDDIAPRQSVISDNVIEAPLGVDGHYHLVLKLNGTPVSFVVDTGASEVVLSRRDAVRVGIDLNTLQFTGIANTANGIVRTAPVRIKSVTLGEITDRNLRASVNAADMDMSLLGMEYLRRFEKIEITDNKLILTR